MAKLPNKIPAQSVGAYGESVVAAELLRHGWLPANVNRTVKNAADFDILAAKDVKGSLRTVHLRVRACSPHMKGAFQFGGFKPGEHVGAKEFGPTDFTILVSMGENRAGDQFYVLPSLVVRREIAARQRDYLSRSRRDGRPRKDAGHWTIKLADRHDGQEEGGWGLAKKWAKYLNAWHLLDGGVPT